MVPAVSVQILAGKKQQLWSARAQLWAVAAIPLHSAPWNSNSLTTGDTLKDQQELIVSASLLQKDCCRFSCVERSGGQH